MYIVRSIRQNLMNFVKKWSDKIHLSLLNRHFRKTFCFKIWSDKIHPSLLNKHCFRAILKNDRIRSTLLCETRILSVQRVSSLQNSNFIRVANSIGSQFGKDPPQVRILHGSGSSTGQDPSRVRILHWSEPSTSSHVGSGSFTSQDPSQVRILHRSESSTNQDLPRCEILQRSGSSTCQDPNPWSSMGQDPPFFRILHRPEFRMFHKSGSSTGRDLPQVHG